ncbi:MAG: universal stress protein [Myxococcota bacterium]
MAKFEDRAHAGRSLMEKLAAFKDEDTIVLGVPGGGVVVGAPIAEALGAPLHIVQVDPVARASRRRASTSRMRRQLNSARSMFDSGAPELGATRSGAAIFGADMPDVAGKTVIIVDDGLRDDLEIHRTLVAFRGHQAKTLIFAVPFIVRSTADLHSSEVNQVIALEMMDELTDARAMYTDPSSPTLEEVKALVTASTRAVVEEDDEHHLYQHILVPVDFSDPSKRAVREALRLQRAGGAMVTLYYVQVDDGTYDGGAVALESINVEQPLIDFAETVVPDSAEVTIKVSGGDPADAILNEVLHGDYDLVVMGTHGRRGLMRAVFGSVAEHVIRDSMTPVLVIR